MARRLTKLQVDEVSVVDKAANGKRFLILKAADGPVEKIARHEGRGTIERLQQRLRKAAGSSGPTTEVEDMTAEEIKKAIADGATEALTPLTERIDKLEAAIAAEAPVTPAAEGTEPVAKSEGEEPSTEPGPSAEQIAKMVTDGVVEALKPITERVEKLESVSGERQSALDAGTPHDVKKSAGGFWEGSGILL